MTEPKMAQKGPYVRQEEPGKKYWCSCGESRKQPYCDGAHARLNTGMRPVPVEFKEPERVAWCGCKRSGQKPRCDGAHNKL